MINKSSLKQLESGVWHVMFNSCTTEVLEKVLINEIRYIWVLGYMPNTKYEWWDTKLPLSTSGTFHNVKARLPIYDLIFELEQFYNVLPELKESGITLIQSNNPMPDSLELTRLNEESRYQVLINNGMELEFHLPHAYEVASLICKNKDKIDKIINKYE